MKEYFFSFIQLLKKDDDNKAKTKHRTNASNAVKNIDVHWT